VSVLSALVGGKPIDHPPLYWEFHERGFVQAARIGDWKAVRHGKNGPVELYDLKADPGEKQDVSAGHPDVVRKFDEYFKTARVDSELWPVRDAPKKGPNKKGGG
jgi:hypothetical protein